MPRSLIAAAVLVVLFTHASSAQADWVFGAFLGVAATADASLRIEQPAVGTNVIARNVSFAGRAFESSLYYGYRMMWAGPRRHRVGVEAELIHLKVYADGGEPVPLSGTVAGAAIDRTAPLRQIVERFSISHGLNLLFANLVWRQPLGGRGTVDERRVVLAIRAGAGPTIPHGESTIGGRTQEQYEWGRVAGQVAAGVECRIARHAAVIAEYKLTGTRQRVSVPDGTAAATFISHHLVAGFGGRF